MEGRPVGDGRRVRVLEQACGASHGWLPARTDRHSPFPGRSSSPTFLVTTAFADLRQIQVEQHSIMQAAVSSHAGWQLSSGGVTALTTASAPSPRQSSTAVLGNLTLVRSKAPRPNRESHRRPVCSASAVVQPLQISSLCIARTHRWPPSG
jgi:hypothetical protein